jgi:hypothetical protein
LPSQRFTRMPTSLGFPRKARLIASICCSSKRRGGPACSPSQPTESRFARLYGAGG